MLGTFVYIVIIIVVLLVAGLLFLKFVKFSESLEDETDVDKEQINPVRSDKQVERKGSLFKKWITRSYPKSRKRGKYNPGRLGVSMVSAAIFEDYGCVLLRRERRQLARKGGLRFIAYYND